MAEEPTQVISRIEADIDNLLEMYSLAEKSYSYTNLHGERSENENDQRRQMVKFNVDRPDKMLTEASAAPLLFVYMMSRAGAKSIFDMSTIFGRPARAFGWLLLGNSILGFWRINLLAQ